MGGKQKSFVSREAKKFCFAAWEKKRQRVLHIMQESKSDANG